jgi:hypothetical protein
LPVPLQGKGRQQFPEVTATRPQMIPVIPGRVEPSIGGKIDAVPVGRLGTRQPIDHFDQNRGAVVLFVQRVEFAEGIERAPVSEAIEQDHEVEVVANRVSRREQPRLDARHLGQRGNPETVHDLIRQRLLSTQLTNSRLNTAEALPMRCMNGSRRAAYEDGARDKSLYVALRSQKSLPIGQVFVHRFSLFPPCTPHGRQA